MNYVKQHSADKLKELLTLLQENYADNLTNPDALNTFGYILLRSNKNLDWALELFKTNVQLHPEDNNIWDSLGDGYLANDLKEDAIKSFQKAVELGNMESQEKLTKLTKN